MLHDRDASHLRQRRLELTQRLAITLEEAIQQQPARRIREGPKQRVVLLHVRDNMSPYGYMSIPERVPSSQRRSGMRLVPTLSLVLVLLVACGPADRTHGNAARDRRCRTHMPGRDRSTRPGVPGSTDRRRPRPCHGRQRLRGRLGGDRRGRTLLGRAPARDLPARPAAGDRADGDRGTRHGPCRPRRRDGSRSRSPTTRGFADATRRPMPR